MTTVRAAVCGVTSRKMMSSWSGAIWLRPGLIRDVVLKLQAREESFAADRLQAEPGTLKDLAVLALDPVVDGDSQRPGQQDVDESTGWAEGRQETGNEDVGVQYPDGDVTHSRARAARASRAAAISFSMSASVRLSTPVVAERVRISRTALRARANTSSWTSSSNVASLVGTMMRRGTPSLVITIAPCRSRSLQTCPGRAASIRDANVFIQYDCTTIRRATHACRRSSRSPIGRRQAPPGSGGRIGD